MQQRRDVVAAQRFVVAQFGLLQADRSRPRAVTVLAEELLPIGFKRRGGQIRREVVDLEIAEHERILNQDRAACILHHADSASSAAPSRRWSTASARRGACIRSPGWHRSRSGSGEMLVMLNVADFALLADRNEDRHLACGCRRTRTRCACSPDPRGIRSDRIDPASARRTARRRRKHPERNAVQSKERARSSTSLCSAQNA